MSIHWCLHIIKRIASLIYDVLVYGGVLLFFCFLAGLLTKGVMTSMQAHAFIAFLISIQCFLYISSVCYLSQTVGMTAWKMKLKSLDGKPLSIRQACIRFFIVLGSFGVVWLSIFFNPKKSLIEKLSGTQVLID